MTLQLLQMYVVAGPEILFQHFFN